ncbi:zinc-binding alcohol dehydrogenase [Reticulomyxa filosa]|uniref:Zinc-binding alcohol dehydrogenase n=1 Tax=Reticulomyxa filosa TaxID=46433 RepID=X6NX34_RETFI|nr:zinc-binding alcohol dehydrogenase [Reticulomyxa filosa]|eukprot:ETO30433.1 zinc-binding alcohol dehydrogenase [Reticulomyxa filosa]
MSAKLNNLNDEQNKAKEKFLNLFVKVFCYLKEKKQESGTSNVLKYESVKFPELVDGQVLIENEFAGLNFIDTYHRSGLYPLPLPQTLGVEGCGTVAQVTPKAKSQYKLKEGDKVAYYDIGSYSQHKIVNAEKTVPIPSKISMDVAGASLVQGMTAHYLMRSTYPLQKGEWCVVHAAAGGVGQCLVQVAKILQAKVIATTSTPEKAQVALQIGADHAVHYNDLKKAVKTATNGISPYIFLFFCKYVERNRQGVSVVYDGVGASTYSTSLEVLRVRGLAVFFGNASGPVPPLDLLQLSRGGSLFVTRPMLAHYLRDREELLWRAQEIFEWIANDQLKIKIDKIYSLQQVAQAHEYIEAGQTQGKILLKCKQ